MGRIFKILGLTVGAVIALFVIVAVAVGLLFDPNDYKDEIVAAVGDATGRTLTLEGDLDLKLFPRIGITMGEAELSNAEGFGDRPFGRVESAELRLGLWPLILRRVEIDSARLTGLNLNLARNAAGVTNWEDLAQAGSDDAATDAADAPARERPDVNISVDAFELADAEVIWRDAVADQEWVLTDFNLRATGLDPSQAFPLSMDFSLEGSNVSVAVDSEMVAAVTLATNTYRLDDLSVDIVGEGPSWPGGSGEAALAFSSLVVNLDDQTVTLDGLELETLGLSVSGNLEGENVMDDPSLAGAIEIADFDPQEVMSVFDANIETADPDVLGRASASADFYYRGTSVGMREMTLSLDDSTLTGEVGMEGGRLEFDLVVDAINIDRYLPPAADDDEAPAEDEGSVDEVDLPIEPLRNFEADGNLVLNQAQFLGMTFENANFALAAGNGRMTLTPTGQLYGGTLDGQVGIQVQGDAARFSLTSALANVDMAGVARDFLKLDSLEGTGNVNIDLASVGSKVGEIKRDLDGTASVELIDGAWVGIDVWHSVRRARAAVGGPDVADIEGDPRTTFERIAIGGDVEDAVLNTNELVGILPFAALDGQGTIDLLTYDLDIRAGAQLVDGPVLQQDPTIARYAGNRVPLTIGGTIDAPDIGVDWRGMIASIAREEVNEEVEEAREEVEQRVDERREEAAEELQQEVEEAQQSLRDRLRDRLGGGNDE